MKYKTISVRHFFPAKGAIYYVAIAMVIFSHVKIMFSRESSPCISLVFIIIKKKYFYRLRPYCLVLVSSMAKETAKGSKKVQLSSDSTSL